MSTSPGIAQPVGTAPAQDDASARVPHEPLGTLFLRFLKFGSLAWGGPVTQIAMIRQELVAEEKWVTPQHFNRVLAMYQVLPGPEAHELCVYFGMLSRGRIGGILAELGFMLPGFISTGAMSRNDTSGLRPAVDTTNHSGERHEWDERRATVASTRGLHTSARHRRAAC